MSPLWPGPLLRRFSTLELAVKHVCGDNSCRESLSGAPGKQQLPASQQIALVPRRCCAQGRGAKGTHQLASAAPNGNLWCLLALRYSPSAAHVFRAASQRTLGPQKLVWLGAGVTVIGSGNEGVGESRRCGAGGAQHSTVQGR